MLVEAGGLFGGHLPADLEEHVGIGFFEISACHDHLIDLGIDQGFVNNPRTRKILQLSFFMPQVLEELYQLALIGLEDFVHTVLLVAAESQAPGETVVVPPAAGWTKLQTSTHRCGLGIPAVRRRTIPWIVARATIGVAGSTAHPAGRWPTRAAGMPLSQSVRAKTRDRERQQERWHRETESPERQWQKTNQSLTCGWCEF
jgi:hypothetical protein